MAHVLHNLPVRVAANTQPISSPHRLMTLLTHVVTTLVCANTANLHPWGPSLITVRKPLSHPSAKYKLSGLITVPSCCLCCTWHGQQGMKASEFTLQSNLACHAYQMTKQRLMPIRTFGQLCQAISVFWNHQKVHWSLRIDVPVYHVH